MKKVIAMLVVVVVAVLIAVATRTRTWSIEPRLTALNQFKTTIILPLMSNMKIRRK